MEVSKEYIDWLKKLKKIEGRGEKEWCTAMGDQPL